MSYVLKTLSSTSITVVRCRSTFYQPRKTAFQLPKFARKFLYRYPKVPFLIPVGLIVGIMLMPVYEGFRVSRVLDKEDYLDYKTQNDAMIRDRAKYGTNLYIPFLNSKKRDEDLLEFYKKRTQERRALKKAMASESQ
ncbi:unnamed protein product [Bursaphelenchus okinawaensis]|uniref:Uncharacterized protein n=1 Tax=Bursaphelenchus okinawaensis TaxID=465554 RepID=A0A811KIU3_9BILA|nr:unnamed protein product [Bursaphelenchus okinawaensis]CAG9103526.1 unnamed protein product [Bursaphelenchus okinawaensis]